MADRFDKFTERARQVLTLAMEEAVRHNHDYIGTEHLLLGLLRQPGGVAASVLVNLGVDLSKAKSAVEFILGRGGKPPRGEIPLTPGSKKVIEFAVEEARRLDHSYIGTEHLLLGLVREGEGVAFGVLESLGITLERVRTETVRVLSQPSSAFAGAPSEEHVLLLYEAPGVGRTLPEDLDGSGLTIAIAVARFNSLVTERLLAGALEGLKEHGVSEERIAIAWVPGSFELPFAALRFAESGRYDAVVCLGCVIKGETEHNEYINHAVANGLQEVGLRTGMPAIFGVVTTNSLEQALARAEEGTTNKGYEAALAALAMANLRRRMGTRNKEQRTS
jgi:6,7-dimethyl-8-ribityllumazine synthase